MLIAAIAGSMGCGDTLSSKPVGQRCYAGAEAELASEAIIAAPALECPTQACLHVPVDEGQPDTAAPADLCTAACTEDAECAGVADTPCESGFVCAIPVVDGPYCCQGQCMCADYLSPDAPTMPPECEPGVQANTCCNIPGNEDLPHCA